MDENVDNEAPTYAKLSGHQKTLSLQNSEEYITFDFIVTTSKDVLSDNDNLQNAIKKSVDCEIEQIHDLSITEIEDGSSKKQCRVKGKIFTDDWELPMLQKKFQKIISDRVLSGNLQNICKLEDRPMIRRFFCKTSRDIEKKKNGGKNIGGSGGKGGGKGNLGVLKTTASLRTLKDDSVKTSDPTIITPTTKPKGKKTESASYSEQEKLKNRNNKNNQENISSSSPNSESSKDNEGNNSSSNDSNSSSTKSEGNNNNTTQPERPSDDQCECFCIVL